MVAKISIGSSLYGALAYNAQKVNADEGKLLATNRVFDGGDGQMDCARLLRDFCNCMPENVRTRNTVIHVSLNPHPDDRLTDMEMANIAQIYMERLGYGNQPYVIVKHEDIDRHHVHIVSVNVDEKGKRIDKDFLFRRSERIRKKLEKEFNLHPAEHKRDKIHEVARKVDIGKGDMKKQIASVLLSLATHYRFQSMGEYRALLSLYNVHVEETRGQGRGAGVSRAGLLGNGRQRQQGGQSFQGITLRQVRRLCRHRETFFFVEETDSRKEIHRTHQTGGASSTWKDLSQGQIC